MGAKGGTKSITQNKKAFHDYFIEERMEAGIELYGTEVKSIRAGAVNLKDAFCSFKDGATQKGDPAPVRPGQADRLHPDPPVALLEGQPGQGGTGAGPGQKAPRQARGHRPAGCRTGDGPGAQGAQPVRYGVAMVSTGMAKPR